MATTQDVISRIARFDELRRDSGSYLDDSLPGHIRDAMMLIGTSRGRNDPSLTSPLPPEDFTMGLQHATTGNGPGLHSHTTVEVFMALSGTWRLYWIADDGEGESELATWDVASVPAGVWRGLELTSEGDGLLLAVRGGGHGGDLAWHPSILEEAARHGRTLDDQGRLVIST
jgi:quercetin dioxygenase-like cupin family protein